METTSPAVTSSPAFAPAPAQQAIVDKLIRLQAELSSREKPLPDQVFARRLGLGSSSRWSLIRSGKYWSMVDSPGLVFVELERALSKYQADCQFDERFDGKTFITNSVFEAVIEGVDTCASKPISDRKRIVIYTAPTGGGKSMLSNELRKKFSAAVVNAHKGWRTRGSQALRDICRKMDVKHSFTDSQNDLENRLLSEFQSAPRPLVIDEGEYFGKDVLDSIKRLINESRCVVVILAIREAYEKWSRYFPMESAQLKMRTHVHVNLDSVTEQLAAPYFAGVKFASDADRDQCVDLLLKRAHALGSYDLLDTVISRLKGTVDQKQFNAVLTTALARIGIAK